MSQEPETLAELQAKAASAVAVEALWNGDTEGWFVELYAVVRGDSGYQSRYLRGFRHGGDIRLFDGRVPPWPEALEAARIGAELGALLGVPFHFPSPHHPEDECPHWWELARSSPCQRCGIALLQAPDCRWSGTCYHCHLALEREAKEALWSPEERLAPRCSICGNPASLKLDAPVWCERCREAYLAFDCSSCGVRVTAHREHVRGPTCSSCAMAKRLASLSDAERQRLRAAAARGTLAGLIEAKELLRCGLGEAREALHALSQASETAGKRQ